MDLINKKGCYRFLEFIRYFGWALQVWIHTFQFSARNNYYLLNMV